MSLLSVADLQQPLDPQAVLDRAEALVTKAICPELPSLKRQQWVSEYRMRNDSRADGVPYFGRRRLGPEVLRYWPITDLISVTQDGLDITGDCTFDRFSIRRDAQSPEFAPLGLVVVTFQTGWAATKLPDEIRQAILLTARDIQAVPEGVVSERIGDVQTTYARAAGTGGLPAAAASLLRSWVYPGV